MTQEPTDIDIDADNFDFSKWKVKQKRGKKGMFYQIMRRDGKKFLVTLPGGEEGLGVLD